MDLVDRLESGLLGEKDLVFCDVKMEHFGLDQSGGMRIIDGGDILFRERQGK